MGRCCRRRRRKGKKGKLVPPKAGMEMVWTWKKRERRRWSGLLKVQKGKWRIGKHWKCGEGGEN